MNDLVEIFQEKSIILLVMFIALPLALPLPAMGIASALSVPMILLLWQMLRGRKVANVGSYLGKKTLSVSLLQKAFKKILPFILWLEKYVRPRFNISPYICSIFMLIFAFSVMLPIPFSNSIPSLGIVICCIGMMEEDGIITAIGFVIGSIGVLITAAIIFAGLSLFS